MLASNLPHSFETSHGPNENSFLAPNKFREKIFKKLNFHPEVVRQQFSIRLYYFLNSSYLHGVRFLDQQYGTIDR